MLSRRGIMAGSSAALVAGLAPRLAWGATAHDVVVIGAGLAGLHTASLLEQAGLKVTVIEAENRIGGRLHTLDDLPGRPEAGGIQIGQSYRILRSIAARLGVALNADAGVGVGAVGSSAALLHINGEILRAEDWATAPANRLVGAERAVSPLALPSFYGRALPALDTPASWLDAPPEQDLSYDEALRQAGASAEARRLIDANMNGNTLAGISAISLARAVALRRAGPGPTMTVRGGSQRLPEAMAAALKGDVRLGASVRAISAGPSGAQVISDRGTITARHVVCTIPFAALRHVPIMADLPPAMAEMIAALPYTRATFAYITARTAFWREDGAPETIWSDHPLIGRIFVLGDTPPMLKLWTFGAGADALDRMGEDGAAEALIPLIEAIRPSAKGQITGLRLFSWQANAHARGIYHHIGTGQAASLAAAIRWQGHRLHFAGEHLGPVAQGMEGALESAEAAARAVLAQA
ncbi:MAG: FAD-dependent oxidoreductase [Porphyrobacter sp.]|jgi:monoamine oxidase|nr:FAD-dependent oxidoreductase [Porphyrobacter sp.]